MIYLYRFPEEVNVAPTTEGVYMLAMPIKLLYM